MLSAATNIHFTRFYDFQSYKFKYDFVAEQLVQMMYNKRSKLLIGCIGNMLQERENGRPNVKDLMDFINKNSDNARM